MVEGNQIDAMVWVRAFRHRILNLLLIVLVGLGTIGLIVSALQHVSAGRITLQLIYYLGAYSFAILILVFRKIPDHYRALGFLLLLYIFSVFTLVTGWLGGGGRTFLLSLTVLAAILLGPRAGVVTVVLSLCTYTIFGIVYQHGWLTYRLAPAFADTGVILIEGIGFSMSLGMIGIGLWFFDEGLKTATQVILESQHARQMLDERARELNETNRLLAERTTHLEAANQELESFSYSVSHDLRGPLRAIDGYSRILLADFTEIFSGESRDYLENVIRSAGRMGMIIDDLLKLSRVTRIDLGRKRVRLSELAQEVMDELYNQAPNRHVKVHIHPGLAVEGDPNLLHIALENLLGNAWKFTERTSEAHIEFGSIGGEDNQVFFVRDNGVGFEMAYSEKLFGTFQRLHREDEFEGTGIGLAIVKRIIDRHGGEIWFDSAVGQGATFYFSLNHHDQTTNLI